MEKISVKILFIANLVLVPLWGHAKTQVPDLTLEQIVSTLEPAAVSKIPAEARSIGFYELKVDKNLLSFKLENIPFIIEVVGQDDVAFKVNGQDFSRWETRSYNSIRRAFLQKFRTAPQYSFFSRLFFSPLMAAESFNPSFEDSAFVDHSQETKESAESSVPSVPHVFNKKSFNYPVYKPSDYRAMRPFMGFLTGSSMRNVFTSMQFLFSGLSHGINNMGAAKPYLDGDPDPTAITAPTFSAF